ncbi:hypothetical protein [Maridesulfovibrio ferrireducens]|nr:hypothetical protein [Maridesulfovibrio ferrireducens]
MNRHPLSMLISFFLLLMLISPHTAYAERLNSFGVNWQFAVNLPQAGLSGVLKGSLKHIKKTDFHFSGEFIPQKSSLKAAKIRINTEVRLEEGSVAFRNLTIQIKKLGIRIPELELQNPDISIKGNGKLFTKNGVAKFENLSIAVGNLPLINTDLNYSPDSDGTLSLNIIDPLPLLEKIAGKLLDEVKPDWEKQGKLDLSLTLRKIKTKPESSFLLKFSELSVASPDGLYLIDNFSGSLKSTIPVNKPQIKATLEINSGEALFDTLYLNLNKHPLKTTLTSTLPDKKGNISSRINTQWEKMGNITAKTLIKKTKNGLNYSGEASLQIPALAAPFKTLAVEPFSLGQLSANGTLALLCTFKGTPEKTILTGNINLTKGDFNSPTITSKSITANIPFSASLGKNLHPQPDKYLTAPKQGFINIGNLDAGQLKLSDFNIPITLSSNKAVFGNLDKIPLGGGKIKLSELAVNNPFSSDFALHGKLNAKDVNLLPLSPPSLPVDGKIDGNIEFWLLKKRFSTLGSFSGEVYGGKIKISEMFADNPFSKSRQYGADFNIEKLKLKPLSEALDIGRITGRMNLDLTDLVIAYDQPAKFKLYAITTPDSDSDQAISLKAVNTLSVIGTGSGLTGVGVGMFSQFFQEFSYAGLGLECTLDHDLFKIRGLIREDGIEYIIKKPPLFGINVINSNPENLISFSDMLKRLKRISGSR